MFLILRYSTSTEKRGLDETLFVDEKEALVQKHRGGRRTLSAELSSLKINRTLNVISGKT